MKDAIAAVAESTAKGAKSMADILRDINLLPSSKTIEIFTKEYKTVYVNTVNTTTTVTAPTTTTTATGCTAPLVSDGKGNCVKPEKPAGDYGWDNAKGWVKGGPGSANDWDFSDNSSGTEKNVRDAAIAETARRIKEEAEAKAAAEALALLKAKEAAELKASKIMMFSDSYYMSRGGMVPKYFAAGGISRGTDTVPAMLTPGEFVMSKYAVDSHGADKMKAINNGNSISDSVYNYSINVNVKSDSNPDEIAKTVIAQIKGIDAQKIRGNRL
jgi:hypothetical protein